MTECWEEDAEDRGTFEDKCSALIEISKRLSDDPVTRESLRNRSGTGAGADEPDLPEPPEKNTTYEEPADSESFSFSTLRAAPGGAKFDPYERPQISPDVASIKTHQAAVAEWIGNQVGRKLDATKLHEELRDGITLCQLLQSVAPEIKVEYVSPATTMLKMMDNIAAFLCGAAAFGIATSDLFEVDDLFDNEDSDRVIMSLVKVKAASK